jgi:prefoldin subunit 5
MEVKLEYQLGQLDARVRSIEERNKHMEAKIDKMYEVITRAEGSWRTLVAVGAASAAIGAVFVKVVEYMFKLDS